MRTIVTDSAEEAAAVIGGGGIVAFPTETVYGLGASVFDEAAVAKIFEAKRRPADNPLIAHIANRQQIADLTTEITETAAAFIEAFFPGPLTIVLPKSVRVPLIATAGLKTIGIRMPTLAVAHQFLLACGVPVVVPSANLSGRPSPTTWQAVVEDLDGRIDCILRGDATEIGLESTVVDCTGDVPILLRQGAVSLAELRSVVPTTVAGGDTADQIARSPGLRHKHYSPRAQVRVGEPTDSDDASKTAFIGLSQPGTPLPFVKVCGSVAEYAHALFEFFRECDRRGIDVIYCQPVPFTGIGAALSDRIDRAAND